MNKQLFLDLVEKYSLGFTIEPVSLEADNGVLKARVVSDDKSLLGEVSVSGFDSKEFGNHKLGIFKTSVFAKHLAVLQENIDVSLQLVGDKATALNLVDDSGVKIHYALSDLAVIPNVPHLKYVPKEFEVVIKITDEFITKYVKARNALPEVSSFAVHSTDKKTQIILGQTDVNTNTITINVETESSAAIDNQLFSAELFKEILVANKGTQASFKVSKEGFAVIEYKTDTYAAKYFLVARAKE